MCYIFHQKINIFACKFTEIDTRIDEVCIRIDEVDVDTTTKISELKTSLHNNYVTTQENVHFEDLNRKYHNISTLSESMNHVNNTQRSINVQFQAISYRISLFFIFIFNL